MWFYLLGARFCFCYFLNHKLNAKDELSSQTAARTKNRYFFFVWMYPKVQTTTFNLVINCKENHNLNWSFHLNWHSCWPATWSHIMNTIHWMRFRQKMFLFYRGVCDNLVQCLRERKKCFPPKKIQRTESLSRPIKICWIVVYWMVKNSDSHEGTERLLFSNVWNFRLPWIIENFKSFLFLLSSDAPHQKWYWWISNGYLRTV